MHIRCVRIRCRIFKFFFLIGIIGLTCGSKLYICAQEPEAKSKEYAGASTCLKSDCHPKREKYRGDVHSEALFKVKGIKFNESCETCHGPGALHSEAAGDKENYMLYQDFYTIKNPKKMSSRELSKICLECHNTGSEFHWEGSQHDLRDVSCLSCHNLHQDKNEANKSLLTQDKVEEVCFQCHNVRKAQFYQRSSVMPVHVGKMTCTDCHNPHGSEGPSLLKYASVNETCYSCHSEKRGPFLWEHPPVREDCTNCHQQHGSQHPRLLKADLPRLCQECHFVTGHNTQPGSPTSLFFAARKCVECHSMIHGSNHPSGARFQR